MAQRIKICDIGGAALQALSVLGSYLKKSLIEGELQHLIHVRMTQITGQSGARNQEKYAHFNATEIGPLLCALNVWEEAECFTAREKAALRWSEAVIGKTVDNEVYCSVKKTLSDNELIDLTLLVTNWHTWYLLQQALSG